MLHIADPDALARLVQVEGEHWLALQNQRPTASDGFYAWEEAWRLKASYVVEHPDYADEPISSFIDNYHGDGAIYGEGGYARYVVRPDGEIVLLRWSVRQEKLERAASLGIAIA